MVAIYKEKKLRVKEYVFPCLLAFCEFWLGVRLLGTTVKSAMRAAGSGETENVTVGHCLWSNPWSHFAFFGTFSSASVLFLISCDRLLAVTWPLWYFTHMPYLKTKLYARIMLACMFSVHIVVVINALRFAGKSTTSCGVMALLVSQGAKFYFCLNVLSWASAAIYAFVAIAVNCNKQMSQISSEERHRQTSITKTLLVIVVLNTCLYSIPTTALAVLKVSGSLTRPTASVLHSVMALNPCVNVVVYMTRNHDLRDTVFGLFGYRKKTGGLKAFARIIKVSPRHTTSNV